MPQDKDDLKIIDFGLARELGEEDSIELDRLQVRTITKHPLFQRNRLTGSDNPSCESCVEVTAQ